MEWVIGIDWNPHIYRSVTDIERWIPLAFLGLHVVLAGSAPARMDCVTAGFGEATSRGPRGAAGRRGGPYPIPSRTLQATPHLQNRTSPASAAASITAGARLWCSIHVRTRGRNPSGDIENALMVRGKVTRENRFVMGDPVAQDSESVEGVVRLPAGQCRAVRERPAQRRPPQRHLIVRLVPGFGPTTRSQQRDPEPERQRSHDPGRIVSVTVTGELGPGTRGYALRRLGRGPRPGGRTMPGHIVRPAGGAWRYAKPLPVPAVVRRRRR